MIIASFNVNSVKARLANVLAWLQTQPVDVLLLQELKGESATFPAQEFTTAGFVHQQVVGQKSYNGVALLSRHPITNPITQLDGDAADTQARLVGGMVNGIQIYNLYAPNGNPLGTEKFTYKLAWLARLHQLAAAEFTRRCPVIFAGDFNIIPTDFDAKNPATWAQDALAQPQSRAAWRQLLNLGYVDALRALHPHEPLYTFWDYQAGAWQKNNGIRIDHFLLSPEAADRLQRAWVDTAPRNADSPSDHTPVLVEISA